VSESVHPENLVNTLSEKKPREFYPILVTDVFGFIDVLISFCGQRSRSQQAEV